MFGRGMAFLWIFALAIVAVATEKPQAPGPVDGCGEPPTTPKPNNHGIVTDTNLCNRTILETNGRKVPASCMVICPSPRKNYKLPTGLPCLLFSEKPFLQERKNELRSKPPYTCEVGVCRNGTCISRRRQPPHLVPCKVPAYRHDWRE
uniref:Evasin n=1 Tax=Amblyomma parvum TaxID=251391 RepID=A0A023FZW1_AMBPA